jgi:RNA polymerase sigma-70 factor (ECF subfamily)
MASPETESITRLIRATQQGRESAVAPLLAVYFDRLVHLARKRLQNLPGMSNYDEDLALRSFYSVYRRVGNREQPLQLSDRDDLWRLLATRTICRAIDLIRRHKPGEVPGEFDPAELLAREPTPEEAAATADECQRLLDLLEEPELQQIALWKVEGQTNEQIAERLNCVPRTVERKLRRIRALWKDELEEIDP